MPLVCRVGNDPRNRVFKTVTQVRCAALLRAAMRCVALAASPAGCLLHAGRWPGQRGARVWLWCVRLRGAPRLSFSRRLHFCMPGPHMHACMVCHTHPVWTLRLCRLNSLSGYDGL